MNTLALPQDHDLLAAVGKVGIRHGQLDYVLRMTVKTLTGVSVREGLDATEGKGSYDLRKMVKNCAKKKFGDPTAITRLDALLNRARKAAQSRNELLHKIWAYDRNGDAVVKDDEHRWSTPPTVAELETVADNLAQIAAELNEARLNGFIRDALGPRA